MKVIYGITKSNFGGAQRYVFELALEAQKSGHDVSVVCGGHGPLVQKLNDANIRIISIPELQRDMSLIKDIKSFFFIMRTLKKERPDVFHTNSSKMGGLGNLAGRMVGIKKIIFTGHGWAFNENRNWLSKIFIWEMTRHTIMLSDKTICVSEKTKQDVICMPLIKTKLVVIYNGLKPFELRPQEDRQFTVVAISELHKVKGLDILLKAWDKFRENHIAKLVIIGDGEEKNNLKKVASDSVVFKGFINDARTQLSAFDIFVMPSRSEALPYALLEAGFAGLPVIASSVGGIPEVIENEENGLLVGKENVEQLASALSRLFDNPSFRERIGANLKQTIASKFSFEKMVKETFSLYGSK